MNEASDSFDTDPMAPADVRARVVRASAVVGCTGILVDAKAERGERFYAKYGFVPLTTGGWPRRMYLPLATARASFAP
ncbi:MAG: hypothetical protein FJ086_01635 [Deltaproteobacteria bacterium]|nr:hypothetical protein [Deltaproteobacteria bacterium]